MDLVSPSLNSNAFHCPFCNVYASMYWQNIAQESKYFLSSAKCLKCSEVSIWRQGRVGLVSFGIGTLVYPAAEILIYPENDMPEDVKIDFNEARSIFYKSPRAAAALLRLALQRLCIHLGQPGKNINDDIRNLVKEGTLSGKIQKAADTVRIIGNNAVHPGAIDEKDLDQIAAKLFKLINMIVYSAITEPKEVDELFNSTPQGARDAIDKRDNQQK